MQFVFLICRYWQNDVTRRATNFFLALRIKPDEILRRGRCGVEERWLELEVGLEVAHFSLHATIQSNCIL